MNTVRLWIHLTWTTLALASCGCTPTSGEARDAYAAQLTACVVQGSTKAEIDACRRAADAQWGVDDAGNVARDAYLSDAYGITTVYSEGGVK